MADPVHSTSHVSASPRQELTSAQRGIWYAQKLSPDNPTYQIGQYLELDGVPDTRLLAIAWTKTLRDIDALCMRFHEGASGPYATLERPHAAENLLTVVDLREVGTQEEARGEARRRMDADLEQARSLRSSDLCATVLFRLPGRRALLFQRVHHIMLDGYSAVITLHYLARVYSALAAWIPPGAARGPVATGIAAAACRKDSPFPRHEELLADLDAYSRTTQYAEDESFWQEELHQETTVGGLEGTPSGTAERVVRVRLPVPDDQAALLRSAGRDVPRIMTAAAGIYLGRMTGHEQVSLGLPVTARRGRIAKSTPSMLSAILPLRLQITPGTEVNDLVRHAGDQVRRVVTHQRFPLENLQETAPAAGPSVNLLPVVDDLQFGKVTGQVHILTTGPVRDLSIVLSGVESDASEPTLHLEGDADLYTEQTLLEHGRRLIRLLSQILTVEHDTTIDKLTVNHGEEATQLLRQGEGPQRSTEADTVLHSFATAAAESPHEPAVVAADGAMTFGELQADSTRLAHQLCRQGVGPGVLVAVRIQRCVQLPLVVLAVLKSGGAYLPLDPEYPVDRVAGMIDDAGPGLLLTSTHQEAADHAHGAEWALPRLILDDAEQEWRQRTDDSTLLPPAEPHDVAYVVFTSGSTGRPKGVGVERLALRNLFHEHREELFDPARQRLGRLARVAHTAGLSFDAAWDPLLWLFAGHQLHIVDDDLRRDPQQLAEMLSNEGIDVIETTPSFAGALLGTGLLSAEGAFAGRRHPTVVAVGGEDVDAGLWDRLGALSGVTVVNLYGPTETTVDSLVAPITAESLPHIGSSVRNSRHYILDGSLQPVPGRAVGELYVAGTNVARGYVGQPGMSASRFIADPYASDGSRMYRTGDVVTRRDDGTLRFMGRMDDQVKIRGYRVELAEIEAALRRLPGVDQAAAVVHGQGSSARVTGYIGRTRDDHQDSINDGHAARELLRTHLPDYMVPSTVAVLEQFPLTPNGKLDRQALPEPQSTAAAGVQQPRTPGQRHVADGFAEVLGLDAGTVGVDDDFFAAGGHSLLATELAAVLSASGERQVTVRDVFERPTVASLAERIQHHDPSAASAPLNAMKRPAIMPVSPAQRRLWFLNQLEPDSAAYNIPVVLNLKGKLDIRSLRSAVNDVVARHDPLRTVFPLHNGEPIQQVLDEQTGHPRFTAVKVPAERLDTAIAHQVHQPFDITADTPLRAVLLSTSAQEHTLVVVMHHIASDGWSLAPFARDLSAAYAARAEGSTPQWSQLPVTYQDFTLWQRERLGHGEDPQSQAYQHAEFWRRELDGAPAEITLPRDRSRGAAPAGIGEHRAELTPQNHTALRRLAAERRGSLFMVLQSALAVALKQHGAGEDIVIGTPVAGRTEPQLEDMVGFFVNTLALRTSLVQDPELTAVLDRVRETNISAYAHQELPFDAVVEALRPERTPHMHPVFQVMLSLQNTQPATVELDGVDVTVPTQITSAGVKTDLMVEVEAHQGDDGPLAVTLAYDRSLFDAQTTGRIMDSFTRVLDAMAEDPSTRISDLSSTDLRTQEWTERKSAGAQRTSPGTIMDAFAETSTKYANSVALIDPQTHLTYQQLKERVDNGAGFLHSAGLRRGDRVVVALPRGVHALTSILAVLRSGAVALPVDLSYPPARIAQIVSDCRPQMVMINGEAPDEQPPDSHWAIAAADSAKMIDPAALLQAAEHPAPAPPTPEDVAYLVHTSGTTGTPKGVEVPHRALQNVLTQHRDVIIGPRQQTCAPDLPRMLHLSGLGFDAAWDPLLWLAAGTTLLIPSEEERVDAHSVLDLLAGSHREAHSGQLSWSHDGDSGGADVVETTPSYAQQLINLGLDERLRGSGGTMTLALGGEPVNPALWRSVADSVALEGWNLYGPSEFTVDSVLTPITGGTPVIGSPINNVTARVLDSSLAVVPPGVEGELYLSGASEAHGYLHRPAETSARFVADPWNNGRRMYRTGDIVRRRADGALEYLRRDDDQVKIRGHRIEIAEVESVLSGVEGVDRVHVQVVTPGTAETAQLAAWLVTSRDLDEVRREASRLLPKYMVPTRMQSIEEIPLTSHGKVDTSALPEPRTHSGARTPQTDQEQKLCAVMAEVLGVSTVMMDDDFFALGGHSLLAVTLVGRLQDELGLTVSIGTVFEASTPAGLLTAGEELRDTMTPPQGEDHGDEQQARHPGSAIVPLSQWAQENPLQRDEEIPLTAGQSRLWFVNQLDPGSPGYNVVLHVELCGDLDPAALSGAVDDLVTRHEILRTTYPVSAEAAQTSAAEPVQRIHPPLEGILRHEPVDSSTGFDLTHQVPFRAGLVQLDESTWRLELVIHHIATDGASLPPLARDLSAAYTARVRGQESLSRGLDVQFADVARREQYLRRSLADHETGTDPALDRWLERLRGAPDELRLPADGSRRESASQPAAQLRAEVPDALNTQISTIAAGRSASRFHGWLAGLAGFLYRIGAGDDIVIGSPSAGRTDPDVENLIGFFVNTMPLRVHVAETEVTFGELVGQARSTTLTALDEDRVPFEQIVEGLSPERQLGRHPVFQTMLTVEEPVDIGLRLPGVEAKALDPDTTGGAKVDLSFTVRPGSGKESGAELVLEYNAAMFSHTAAQRLMDQWLLFLRDVTTHPQRPLAEAPLFGASTALESWEPARDQLRVQSHPQRSAATVIEALGQTVHQHPQRTALVTQEKSLTFAELAARTAQLSAGLTALNVGRGDVVAIQLPRSVDTVCMLLAVWTIGAVAMPVDTALPEARVESMFSVLRPSAVVHTDSVPQPATVRSLPLPSVLSAGDISSRPEAVDRFDTDGWFSPEDPAYVIFTSGTTGQPKAVQVPHQALGNLLDSHRSTLMPDPEIRRHRLAHTTGVGFDAAMDPVLWLIAGHELHLIDDQTRRDPEALVEDFRLRGITAWEATPSYVNAVLAYTDFGSHPNTCSEDSPFLLLLGGEPVDPGLWEWARTHTTLSAWNLYGPTEAGVDALVSAVEEDPRPDLGAPTSATSAYVLDDWMRPVPDGAVGELWLAGEQLAHGYVGQPAATGRSFVANPFLTDGSRMYRTGDLAVVEPPAEGGRPRVRALGRADDQVKIRGYRVELGEVETVLRAHQNVAQAVVRLRTAPQGDQLVAWVVPQGCSPEEPEEQARLRAELLSQLRAQLPAYMVPSALSFLMEIPLTPNGKVDEQKLPAPQTAHAGSSGRLPSTAAEEAVAGVFARTLHASEVMAEHSFFELGGHSFLAHPVISGVNEALQANLPLQAIFQAPTVESLAALAESGQAETAESLRPVLRLRPAGQGEPIFAVHPGSGLSWAFSSLVTHLGTERPVLGLQMHGLAPDTPEIGEPETMQELTDRYVQTIRAEQPEGPYHLVGWSFGGLLAHFIAVELESAGHEVDTLAVLDAYPSQSSLSGLADEQDSWKAFLRTHGIDPPQDQILSAHSAVKLLEEKGSPLAAVPPESMNRAVHRFRRIGELLDSTEPGVFSGDMHLIEAGEQIPKTRPAPESWRPYLNGSLHVDRVALTHQQMLEPEGVRALGRNAPRLLAARTSEARSTTE